MKILILIIVLLNFITVFLGAGPAVIKNAGWLTWPGSGRTIGPFILYKDKVPNFRLVTHELIHWEQQKELYYIGWWILYPACFIWGALMYIIYGQTYHGFMYRSTDIKGFFHKLYWHAYRNNPFELEAHRNQYKNTYLLRRVKFGWADYWSY